MTEWRLVPEGCPILAISDDETVFISLEEYLRRAGNDWR